MSIQIEWKAPLNLELCVALCVSDVTGAEVAALVPTHLAGETIGLAAFLQVAHGVRVNPDWSDINKLALGLFVHPDPHSREVLVRDNRKAMNVANDLARVSRAYGQNTQPGPKNRLNVGKYHK